MNKLYVLFTIVLLFGCGVHSKVNSEVESWEKKQNYSIIKPNSWRALMSHGYANYSPLPKEQNYYYNTTYIISYRLRDKPLSLENFVKQSVGSAKIALSFISEEIIANVDGIFTHEGEFAWNGNIYKQMVIYFEHENEYYSFTYSSLKEYYDMYLNDAMSIYNSITFD